MKYVKGIAALAAVAACLAATTVFAADKSAEIDKPAPGFELTDVNGKTHKLSDYKGKWVVLEWTNFQCPFVRRHYGAGNMQALQHSYGEKGVVWLTICSSAPGKQGHFDNAEIKKHMKEMKLASAAYLVDENGKVGRLYQARTTPHMFVINPEGTLIYAGAIDDKPSTKKEDLEEIRKTTNYVKACLDAAMAGKAVEVHTSTPYGCAVKYDVSRQKPAEESNRDPAKADG